jgi:hypothetical protein
MQEKGVAGLVFGNLREVLTFGGRGARWADIISKTRRSASSSTPFSSSAARTTIAGDCGLGYFEHGKKIGEVSRELPDL